MPRKPRAAPQPRLCRHLPQLVTDILQSGREAGRPYYYTTGDVRAIVQYVSEAPRVTPGAFTPTNWDEVDAFAEVLALLLASLARTAEAEGRLSRIAALTRG